jgi:hypothetical protein
MKQRFCYSKYPWREPKKRKKEEGEKKEEKRNYTLRII